MRFGAYPVAEALGGVVAHAVRVGEGLLKKGRVIGPDEQAALEAAGVATVVVALPDAGDLAEDEAARVVAAASAGSHVRVEPPATGRANLFAEADGVLLIDATAIDRANAIDEAVTVATLPAFRAVVAGEMVGTVKIIPFFADGGAVARAAQAVTGAVRVQPFRAMRVAVVSTLLPGLKASIVDKTVAVTAERLAALARSQIIADIRVAHEAGALTDALGALPDCDLVLIFGASAITDRRDVIPAALEQAGGMVAHLGMPVDPGNLLMLGSRHGTPVLGAPGCARSPRENGFDWVLQRLAAGLPISRADIQAMGVGGLLMEIISRPQPRAEIAPAVLPRIEGVVLAAGQSRRMGANKLVAEVGGRAAVRAVVEAAVGSRLGRVHVVTGHEADAVRGALTGLDVRFEHNADYASGMAGSLRVGLGAISDDADGALILLGDMPLVTSGVIDRLIGVFAAEPEAKAVVPVASGRRANPVLLSRALFDAVSTLGGDMGARALLEAAGDAVIEVQVDDEGVLIDIDTPDALERARHASHR